MEWGGDSAHYSSICLPSTAILHCCIYHNTLVCITGYFCYDIYHFNALCRKLSSAIFSTRILGPPSLGPPGPNKSPHGSLERLSFTYLYFISLWWGIWRCSNAITYCKFFTHQFPCSWDVFTKYKKHLDSDHSVLQHQVCQSNSRLGFSRQLNDKSWQGEKA